MFTNEPEDRLFAALADGTRRQIVRRLVAEPLPVHKLAADFSVTRPAISRHLRILKAAGLVGVNEEGRQNVYFLKTGALREVEDWLNAIWAGRLFKLKSLAEEVPDD